MNFDRDSKLSLPKYMWKYFNLIRIAINNLNTSYFGPQFSPITRKTFWNLANSNKNQIVFIFFRLIWIQITRKMVNTIWFWIELTRFKKKILCAVRAWSAVRSADRPCMSTVAMEWPRRLTVAIVSLALKELYFSFVLNRKEFCYTENFLFIMNETEFLFVYDQQEIVSTIIFLSIWKKLSV